MEKEALTDKKSHEKAYFSHYNYYLPCNRRFVQVFSWFCMELATAPAHTTKSVTTGIIPNNGVHR